MSLEKTRLTVGFMPLCDSAPLIVAKERGFFAEQGLQVELCREPSWANIRDKLVVGALDAAQMLAPMPLSVTLGLGNLQAPLLTGLGLNLGGNAITVANGLRRRLDGGGAKALKSLIDADQTAGRAPLTFATVYPFSSHNYELRLWLAEAGIDPDHDVRLVVLPPGQMVPNLAAGHIAGYCVGEPWNAMAVHLALGHPLVTCREIGPPHVEKVLGVRRDWAERHPATHLALLRAVLAACRWADDPDNRTELADIAAQPGYVDAPQEVVRAVLTQRETILFHRGNANRPDHAHGAWYLGQMRRWGQLPAGLDDAAAVRETFRPDLFDAANR